MIAALQVLLALRRWQVSLAEARSGLALCPQVLINVRFAAGTSDPLQHPQLQQACVDVEREMAGEGRVLLRKSGTEPLLRVMVEGRDALQVRQHAEHLAGLVAQLCT